MLIFTKYKQWLSYYKNNHTSLGTVGFVPTMGALHSGHISLLQAAKKQNKTCVVSIFVNPTQFNNKADLEKYPRTLTEDISLLSKYQCDVLYAPQAEDVYDEDSIVPNVDLNGMDMLWEGEHRPGHFAGVVQVVYLLLQRIQPHSLYLGEKDWQQCAVLKKLIDQHFKSITLFTCPTLRENNGLAMSSRNKRLSADQTQIAAGIYKALNKAKQKINTYSVNVSEHSTHLRDIEKTAIAELAIFSKPEYLKVINAISLQEAQSLSEPMQIIVATWVGEVRLIDNIAV